MSLKKMRTCCMIFTVPMLVLLMGALIHRAFFFFSFFFERCDWSDYELWMHWSRWCVYFVFVFFIRLTMYCELCMYLWSWERERERVVYIFGRVLRCDRWLWTVCAHTSSDQTSSGKTRLIANFYFFLTVCSLSHCCWYRWLRDLFCT